LDPRKGLCLLHLLLIFALEDCFSMYKVTLSLRGCDMLDGTSNFVPSKLRLQLLMEEADLWEHVLKEILEPIDPVQLASNQKMEAKVKRIILDHVKDHFTSHIVEKKTSKKMLEALVELFQNSCASQ
jgi:hypothetical protein